MVKFYPPGTRKGNRTYVARGYVGGRQYEVVTDAKNARTAQKYWSVFRDEVLSDAQKRRGESRRGTPKTFGDAIDRYKESQSPSKTDEKYLDIINTDAIAGELLDDVRSADVSALANKLYPNGKASTKNRSIVAPCAAVLHFAAANEWVSYRVVSRFKEPEPEPRRPANQVRGLLLGNTVSVKRALLTVLFFQGWRITESLGLRWEHINWEEQSVALYVSKSRKWQFLPLHDEVFAVLTELHDGQETGCVFPWRTRSGVYKWLRPLCKKLGVTFTPHMARHEFGGRLREKGATNRDLVDVGSWTSERSTARYTSAGSSHARSIIGRLTTGGSRRGRKAK